MESDNKPWWWPQVIDEDHLVRLREEYEIDQMTSDDKLLDEYEDGKRIGDFSTLWDHTGDAYDQFAALARAFLDLVERVERENQEAVLREALTEIRDRIKEHPAYAELTDQEEMETGGDTAELSYLAKIADSALGRENPGPD